MTERSVLEPTSPWWEKCARHENAQTARTLQHIYLCDDCAAILVERALNHRPFIYHGETVTGFCGLCNRTTAVTLRQHFACHPCWAVVQSYQKGFVASVAVHDVWKTLIGPRLPALRIEETEPISIAPYVRKKSTKKVASETLETLDFKVTENFVPLFHVELKSGPASMDDMSEFQLDVNDYNDIIGASCYTKLPSYIFHVELRQEYALPTRGTRAAGIWWTDFFRLRKNLKKVRQRRHEDKAAGYFDTKAFQPIETFAAEVEKKGYLDLHDCLDAAKLALPLDT